VVATDLIGVLAVGVIVVFSAATAEQALLDAAIVIALIGFVATIAYARYVERGHE
jgi:multicomponent Na+:H+ antiporter subunit F